MDEYKTCSTCGQTKTLEEFPKHKDCYLGRGAQCKKCKYARSIQLRESDPEKYKAKAKAIRDKNKQKRADYQRQWRKENPEAYREQARRHYWSNPQKFRERRRNYSANNPETDLRNNRKRRAKILGTQLVPYTASEILSLYGTNCHLCNLPIDLEAPRWTAMPGWENGLHLDHVIPLSLGGTDTLDNVKPAHGKCNLAKNRILPKAFRSAEET